LAEDAILFSNWNGLFAVWIFLEVLELKNIDWAYLNAYAVAVAFFPINFNVYHF
jgi:hypothetical protein